MLSLILAAAAALAGMLAILRAWQLPPFETAVVSTENAYVRGHTTIISPQVSGYIQTIVARDYESVAAGAELLRIDDRVYRQMLAEAEANLDIARANLANNRQTLAQRNYDIVTAEAKITSAQAQATKAEGDLTRITRLVERGSSAVSELDAARAVGLSMEASLKEAQALRDSARQALRSAEVNTVALQSQVESAQAKLELARIDLDYTVVRAPETGELSDVGARVGQYVTNGSQLVFLVPRERWVVANFKEAQTANIRIGARAWFTVDALDDHSYKGVVERISPAAGSEFSVLRTDNAIGNFVKIPQRISVKILIDGDERGGRLRPGMSVEAFVDTETGTK
ncbi:multidrug resistance protein A (plasmid) [Ensifer adhaerens OV14]|nr:multidrug resistance protein A [Ensifer adhaerens OV14]